MTVHFATGEALDKAPPHRSYALLIDEKSTGTDGGTFSDGGWRVRDINNTAAVDTDGIVSFNASHNQAFILSAGTYFIRWSAPAYRVSKHQSVLYKESGTQTIYAYGSSERTSNGTAVVNRSFGQWRGTITYNIHFQIRHQCATTYSTSGFGLAGDFGTEVYTMVEIFKEY